MTIFIRISTIFYTVDLSLWCYFHNCQKL